MSASLAVILLVTTLGRSTNETPVEYLPCPRSQDSQPGSEGARWEDPVDRAARKAFAALPKREKVGRIRGLSARSEVRFLSAPDTAYTLVGSFSTPQRSRVVLSSADGAFERYQVGSTLFGRDLVGQTAAEKSPSYVLEGSGHTETLLDIELRRALFFWPDAPKFTGAGTTFTAKIEDLGVLLATVDQGSGLPTRIRSLGQDGKTAAEFHSIVWTKPESEEGRRSPASFTFAAGGSDLWKESVKEVDDSWLFSDVWFLPSDRVTTVIGSEVAGKLRLRAVPSAWVFRRELSEETRTIQPSLDAAASAWGDFAGVAPKTFGKDGPFALTPDVELILDASDRPVAFELAVTGPRTKKPDGESWRWRGARNIWASALDLSDEENETSSFEAARRVLDTAPTSDDSPQNGARVRFRAHLKSEGGVLRYTAVDVELVADAPLGDSEPESRR